MSRARSHGEVLTPNWMVQEMLGTVESIVTNPHTYVLDLCAGPGAFIVAILDKRLQALSNGDTDFEHILMSLASLHAFELMPDNVTLCRQRMSTIVMDYCLSHKIVLSDYDLARIKHLLHQNIQEVDVLHRGEEVTVPDKETGKLTLLTPGYFDYIVSNPPYQKNISGSTDAQRLRNHSKSTPIYQHFYDYARWLEPQDMSFIMPAKWYTGGWGLDKWRASVISDPNIRILHDYRDSSIIFPGTYVNGGICWLYRSSRADGEEYPRIVQFDRSGERFSDQRRPLKVDNADFFIRDPQAASILDKVGCFNQTDDQRFSSLILPATPFGIPSNFKAYQEQQSPQHNVALYYIKKKTYWIEPSQILRNASYVDDWKIFLSLSYNQHSPQIINEPAIFGPGSVCSHSYIAVVGFVGQAEAINAVSYMRTKFFRYLAHQLKISPIATRSVYRLIPQQSWSQAWTDAELYSRYGLSVAEIEHIERTISPM